MTGVPEATQLQLTPRDFYVSGILQLLRIDRASGDRTTLLENGSANRLAVDEDALYYTTIHGLFRVEHDGEVSKPVVVVEEVEEVDGVIGLAVDTDFVYFTPFQAPGIFRVPKTGGNPEKLCDQKRAGELALTDSHVYFASFFRNRIGRIPRSGGRVQGVISARGPVGLEIDGPFAVALTETSEDVLAIDLRSRKRRKLGKAGKNPDSLLLQGGYAYWTTGKIAPEDPTFIRRVAATGGAVETLVSDEASLNLLHVEDGWLYFSSPREPTVVRLRLPARVSSASDDR